MSVDVQGASEVLVRTGSAFKRGLGFTLMVGGGTLALVGASLIYSDVNSKAAQQELGLHDYQTPEWFLPMEIAGGIGLAVALVGLPLYLSGQPSVKVIPALEQAEAAPRAITHRSRFAFAPVVGSRGGGLRLRWSF